MSAFSGLTINRGNGDEGSGSVTLTISENLLWAVSRALETCGKQHRNTAQESLGYFLRDSLFVIRGEKDLDDFPLLKKIVVNVAPPVEEYVEDKFMQNLGRATRLHPTVSIEDTDYSGVGKSAMALKVLRAFKDKGKGDVVIVNHDMFNDVE